MSRLVAAVLGLALGGCTFDSRGAPRNTLQAKSTDHFPATWTGSSPNSARHVDQRQAADDAAAFIAASAVGTVESYVGYLGRYPEGRSRNDAIVGARDLAAAESDDAARIRAYEALIMAAPDAIASVPQSASLLLSGPQGMRVKDLLAMRASGLGDEVIAAKIASDNVAYRAFTIEELGQLRELGLPDPMVKAMIESTARALKEKRDEHERAALHQEIAELKKQVADRGSGAAAGGSAVQTKEGPMDTAACMAKRLAAMKLCEQVPWPGSTVCSSSAQASFPCK